MEKSINLLVIGKGLTGYTEHEKGELSRQFSFIQNLMEQVDWYWIWKHLEVISKTGFSYTPRKKLLTTFTKNNLPSICF